jgi:VWFA-related protein
VPVRAQAYSGTTAFAVRAATTQPNGRPQASPEVTTIREYSNLVVVDVVVSDSQGNPIHGLRPSDFALLENNKLQILKHFEEHSAVPASDLKIALAPKLPPGLFTNKTPAPANGPVNVLLLDYLNTPLASQPFLRMQLREFLDKAPAGTRIAIFFLNTQLSMLQGFTSDMSVLKAALASKKGVPDVSHIAQGKDTTLDALTINQPQEIIDSVHRMESLDASDRRNMQALYTLNAFDMLARYLVGIPGRKNVIWFSGGFPLDVEPDLNEADPNDSVVRNDDAVRQTDNLLTRAQVAVYPVDARGLQGDPALSDGLGGQALLDARANAAYNLAVPSGVTPDKANDAVQGASVMAWLQTHAQEQLTMMAMAEDTGGEAFVNTNSLAQAATRAIEHGSNYYTLTYSPTNIQWDARFRTIKVKVNQSGAKLIYRNGYYAVDPNDRNKLNAAGAATALAQTNTMATAMMHGGPEATEILFKVRIRPVNEVPSDAVPASNQVNPKMNVVGPYRQYAVDLVPDAQAVNCHEGADGNRHCAIEVWTFVYNSDGEKVITASNRLHNLLTPADYKKLLAGGMAFHQQISVPAKGEYYLRTAIHDMVSDRVGAVEVPVGAVARLDPLKQVAAVAPAPTSTPAVSVPVEVPSTAPPAAEPTAPPTLKRRAAPSTNSADPTGTPN